MSKQPEKMSVAAYLTKLINQSPKSQKEIAEEVGYEKPNIITMFKQGKTKVPLNKVGPLAKALKVDPQQLLRLVMQEYSPATWQTFEEDLGHMILTEDEVRLVLSYRLMLMDD